MMTTRMRARSIRGVFALPAGIGWLGAPGAGNRGPTGSTTTWSPTDKTSTVALSAGDMTATFPNDGDNKGIRSTTGSSSGLEYFEVNIDTIGTGPNTSAMLGVALSSASLIFGTSGHVFVSRLGDVLVNNAGTGLSIGTPIQGDVIGVAFSATHVWFARNGGLWNGTAGGNPSSGVDGVALPAAGTWHAWANYPDNLAPKVLTLNCGATLFAYPMPAGASAL